MHQDAESLEPLDAIHCKMLQEKPEYPSSVKAKKKLHAWKFWSLSRFLGLLAPPGVAMTNFSIDHKHLDHGKSHSTRRARNLTNEQQTQSQKVRSALIPRKAAFVYSTSSEHNYYMGIWHLNALSIRLVLASSRSLWVSIIACSMQRDLFWFSEVPWEKESQCRSQNIILGHFWYSFSIAQEFLLSPARIGPLVHRFRVLHNPPHLRKKRWSTSENLIWQWMHNSENLTPRKQMRREVGSLQVIAFPGWEGNLFQDSVFSSNNAWETSKIWLGHCPQERIGSRSNSESLRLTTCLFFRGLCLTCRSSYLHLRHTSVPYGSHMLSKPACCSIPALFQHLVNTWTELCINKSNLWHKTSIGRSRKDDQTWGMNTSDLKSSHTVHLGPTYWVGLQTHC